MAELLQELRVALPGVQILFAFLLTVPFAQGFERVTDFQKNLFFATLLVHGDLDALHRARRRPTGCASTSATART